MAEGPRTPATAAAEVPLPGQPGYRATCPNCGSSAFVGTCACGDLSVIHYVCDACDLAFGVTPEGKPCSPFKGVPIQ